MGDQLVRTLETGLEHGKNVSFHMFTLGATGREKEIEPNLIGDIGAG